jgi:hypothetical protein
LIFQGRVSLSSSDCPRVYSSTDQAGLELCLSSARIKGMYLHHPALFPFKILFYDHILSYDWFLRWRFPKLTMLALSSRIKQASCLSLECLRPQPISSPHLPYAFFFFFWFFECSPGCPGTRKSACLCLPSAEIKGMCHQAQHLMPSFTGYL